MKTIRDPNEPNKITLDTDVIKHMADHSIDDSETIRQISLYSSRGEDRQLARILNRKVNPMFAYAGLYPEIMTSYDIIPDDIPNNVNKMLEDLLEERKKFKKLKKQKKHLIILTYDNYYLDAIIGERYTATGTCGITDGIKVEGILTKIDHGGAYLNCDKGIPHLCNEKTLKECTKL